MDETRRWLLLDLQWFADQEKTEDATPKKREEAREKGQIARSMEVPSSLLILGSFGLLAGYGTYIGARLREWFAAGLGNWAHQEVSTHNATSLLTQLMIQSLWLLAPVFALGILLSLASGWLQYGFLFTVEPLKMKLEKLNPIEGAKQIFSLRSLVELVKSLVKIGLISAVVLWVLWQERATLLTLGHVPVWESFTFVSQLTLRLGLTVGGILCVVALADYLYQRYEWEKNLRMSLQEVKDEYKKTEGDPLIRSRIREKQRKMTMQRMMQEVPKADVVITNPTHFAVAIQYDAQTMTAPKVIAKGVDFIAMKMKQVAKESNVMVVENKPLARALVAQVDIGQSVPPELFQAVASVLAYVYQVRGQR